VALSPQDPGLRNKFALSLYKLGYFKEAQAQLQKVIKQRPRDAQNYDALSLVYKKQGKIKQAEEMAKKACFYSKRQKI
jgi:predicted Zn-dependent protease